MFSSKQLEVFKFPYEDQYDALICDGSIRSGKSSATSTSFILWAMNTFNNKNFGLCSKTIGVCERNIIKPLLTIKYLQDNFSMKYLMNARCLIVTRGNRTNYFYCFGGTDESSYKNIQGITLAGVLLDEVALMPESFVNQAIARCSVTGAKLFFNCNPESPSHWFYKKWILMAEQKRVKYLHFEMADNPSLSPDTMRRYENSYTGVFYERYIKGKWVKAEGLIYQIFADNNEKFIVNDEWVKSKNLWFIECGIDFGNNKSSHTFVAVGYTRNFKEVIILENKKISKSITPTELDDAFAEFVSFVYERYAKPFDCDCDSAETTLINGFKMVVVNRNLYFCNICNARKSPINDRILLTLRLFAEGRLFVKDNCKEMIAAYNEAVWDDKKPDERLDVVGPDNPVDMLDACEYAIEKYSKQLIMI